jgi:hypothetical protein
VPLTETVIDVHALCEWAGRQAEGHVSGADLRVLAWDPEAADIQLGRYTGGSSAGANGSGSDYTGSRLSYAS